MLRIIITPVLYLLLAVPPAVLAQQQFDISYVWSSDLANVRAYRDKVGRVLGPAVSSRLKVVSNNSLYGVVYLRRGDNAGAGKVANAHTRLLQSRGLEAAAAVPSRPWVLIDDTASAAVSSARRTLSAQEPMIRDLEVAVESYIKQLRREGKLEPDERTGWSVYDFTTGRKLVTINEDIQFQAASLVKPFIATAFFHKIEAGELVYGPKSRRHMQRMIQRSDNRSTNWVVRQVGGPNAVQRILHDNYPGIFQETHLVEYIPANGRTYRNKASIHDYSRFLYALWTEELPGAREIKRLMALPGSDRIYTGARDIPKGTQVYNKTGSTARVCGDMGILNVKGRDGKRYPYTLIGIIEKQSRAPNYTAWIRSRSDVIRNVSNIVYKGIAAHHEL
jgi:beta-lactamase class A